MCEYIEKNKLNNKMKFYLDERLFPKRDLLGKNIVFNRSEADVCVINYKGATETVKNTFKTKYCTIASNYYDFACENNNFMPTENELKKITKQFLSNDPDSIKLSSAIIMYLNCNYRDFKNWIYQKSLSFNISQHRMCGAMNYAVFNNVSLKYIRDLKIPEDNKKLYESFVL